MVRFAKLIGCICCVCGSWGKLERNTREVLRRIVGDVGECFV